MPHLYASHSILMVDVVNSFESLCHLTSIDTLLYELVNVVSSKAGRRNNANVNAVLLHLIKEL